jgi:hypothetical protein
MRGSVIAVGTCGAVRECVGPGGQTGFAHACVRHSRHAGADTCIVGARPNRASPARGFVIALGTVRAVRECAGPGVRTGLRRACARRRCRNVGAARVCRSSRSNTASARRALAVALETLVQDRRVGLGRQTGPWPCRQPCPWPCRQTAEQSRGVTPARRIMDHRARGHVTGSCPWLLSVLCGADRLGALTSCNGGLAHLDRAAQTRCRDGSMGSLPQRAWPHRDRSSAARATDKRCRHLPIR